MSKTLSRLSAYDFSDSKIAHPYFASDGDSKKVCQALRKFADDIEVGTINVCEVIVSTKMSPSELTLSELSVVFEERQEGWSLE